MKLLLALDLSPFSEVIVSEVARRPWPAGTKACALNVFDLLCLPGGFACSVSAACSIAARPWPQDSEVRVVSVVDAAELYQFDEKASAHLREATTIEAQEATEIAEKIVSDGSLQTTRKVLTGHPKEVIVDEAGRWGADLIVVGSHGRRGLKRILLGSVSEAVALHAHCSVEVVRQRIESPPAHGGV